MEQFSLEENRKKKKIMGTLRRVVLDGWQGSLWSKPMLEHKKLMV